MVTRVAYLRVETQNRFLDCSSRTSPCLNVSGARSRYLIEACLFPGRSSVSSSLVRNTVLASLQQSEAHENKLSQPFTLARHSAEAYISTRARKRSSDAWLARASLPVAAAQPLLPPRPNAVSFLSFFTPSCFSLLPFLQLHQVGNLHFDARKIHAYPRSRSS